MGILKYFLYLIFPVFILAELARVQVTSFMGITLLDVMVGIFALGFVAISIKRKNLSLAKELQKPVIFVVLSFVLSLLINSTVLKSDQLFYSSLYLIRFMAYGTLLLQVIKAKDNVKDTLIHFMTVSGAIIVILGLLQLIFFNDLKALYAYGWDDHLYRLFSTFLDPNFVGMFLVVFLLFQLPFLIKILQEGDMYRRVQRLFLISLTALSILLTYSRTAYAMAIVGVVVYLLLGKKKILVVPTIIIIFLCVLLFANTKIEGLNPFRTASTSARIESINIATQIIKDHPFFGVGFNAYRYAQIRYNFRQEITPNPTHADSGTDNSFLFILATSGALGLSAYLYFLYSLFKSVYVKKSFLRNTFLASLIAWMVGSLFINGLFYPEMMFWMWIQYVVTRE